MASLEQALEVPDLPEITQTILNLAEFMEHSDKGPLPLDPKLLGRQAMKCKAYAKALHYKETEFHNVRIFIFKQYLEKRTIFRKLKIYVLNIEAYLEMLGND